MLEIIKEKVEEFIMRFSRALQINRIYGKDHDLAKESIESLYAVLIEILKQREEFTLGIIGEEIAFDKEPLYELSTRKQGLINHLKTIGVDKISMIRGIEKKELSEWISILAVKPNSADWPSAIRKSMAEAQIRHVSTGNIGLQEKKKTLPSIPIQRERMRELMKNNFQNSVQFLTKTFQDLKGNQPLNIESARQIVDGLMKNLLQNKSLLLMLTSLKGHDENTFMHGVNVAVFTLLQAEVLGLEQKYLIDMGMAALLHDVGKISVSPEALEEMNSIETWTPEQEEKQEAQDIAGAKILLDTEGIGVLAAIAAFEHNIKFDMSGHPRKIYGKQLNLVSMMIAISDYYDQLRRKPSFYEDGGPEKAYDEMMGLSGTAFHPDLLKNFFSTIGVYPPGTLVELNTKEIGLVIQASMLDIKRPQIEILYDSNGDKYKEPHIVNLIEKDKKGQYKRTIVKSISPVDKFQVPDKFI